MEELLDLPFQHGGVQKFMSICASALEICVAFPTSSLFLINYMKELWIIHPPPLVSHFPNGFPSFLDFSWHHSGLPDQAEVATIGWRNFNCVFKKITSRKFLFSQSTIGGLA